ncbi:hypothetical protein AMATHDRAFT_76589 [Amanita thiersii Skay4041]|uniref:HECT domain-containing protein n=1 Tax=Amanita thiersii Skay4041 TaxID=703135 RepID=A0A2A9NLW9_9AGAR|nr:hypothetical protein AMATHDRAFT_76589 [Amanita thiersii Skay4041]
MATLSRTRSTSDQIEQSSLLEGVPAPFPIQQLQQQIWSPQNHSNRQDTTNLQQSHNSNTSLPVIDGEVNAQSTAPQGVLQDLLPSIAYIQKSCLMTLNNLFSVPVNWSSIIPERRHSMPSNSQGSATQNYEMDSSTALQALVTNLRSRDPPQEMTEYHNPTTDAELIQELRMCVERASLSLGYEDAALAKALVSLLSHFNRLSVIGATASNTQEQSSISQSQGGHTFSPSDLLGTLTYQLSTLRRERLSSQPSILGPSAPPVLVVEAALLWSRIDEELETLLSLCRERTEDLLIRSPTDSVFPPQYEAPYTDEAPPEYNEEPRMSFDEGKGKETSQAGGSGRYMDEKMRLDLENITTAIDRLYCVAPQLHNQRAELKSSKLSQSEHERQQAASESASSNEADVRELDNILNLLSKASGRSLVDQSFVLDGGMQRLLEKVKNREQQEREAFVAKLVRHSGSRRLHSQDAVYQPRTKDPNALLTLPEFIREPAPSEFLKEDPNALLTLPEFVREPIPKNAKIGTPELRELIDLRGKKKSRTRSLSAPHLSWLRPSSRSPASSGTQTPNKGKSKMSDSTCMNGWHGTGIDKYLVEFDVAYVAENHETLRHIVIFLQVTGATPGVDIELEVLTPSNISTKGGDHFVVKSGPRISQPLPLPGNASPGLKEVKVQKGHFQIKFPSVPSSQPLESSNEHHLPLLDASQLMASTPSSFICASCSLPVVHSSNISNYSDLPSEHWEELVDAWMCHTDQKLHDHVARHGRMGFWPKSGQALVGGSYILFDEASLVRDNLYTAKENKRGEEWRLVRCLCGAVLGRCQEHQQEDAGAPTTVFRILKYAIRPVSITSEPRKIPLSAYVVEDMNEFMQAHATYRFVVLDEEEERLRIIMWLFKPNMRLAYNTWSPRASPKCGSIHAARVLYKLFRPSEEPVDLNSVLDKYPGFPQAEYLCYPMDICRQIATLLRESNLSYPESLRMMTDLEVGWLRRA